MEDKELFTHQVLDVEAVSFANGALEARQNVHLLEAGEDEGFHTGLRVGRILGAEAAYYSGVATTVLALQEVTTAERSVRSAKSLQSSADGGLSREDPEASLSAMRSKCRLLATQVELADNGLAFPLEERKAAPGSLSF